LVYDIKEVRLKTLIDDETTIFRVLKNKKYFYPGDLIYHIIHYLDGTFPDSKIREYIFGNWEEKILEEYQRRFNYITSFYFLQKLFFY